MSRKNNEQVLISGAGPAGLAAGIFLREANLDVTIIDPHVCATDERLAVILHPDTVQRLADVDIVVEVPGESRRVAKIALYDRMRWRADVTLHPRPAVILPLWLLCKKLETGLRDRGVKVRWKHRLCRVDVHGDAVDADVDLIDVDTGGYAVAVDEGVVVWTQHLHPGFLIAADGRDSPVRQQLGVRTKPIAAPELVAAFEVDTPFALDDEMRVVVGDGSCVMWPLPDGGLRLTFELRADDPILAPHLRDGVAIDQRDLAELLAIHVPWFDAPIGAIRRWHLERVQPAVAERARLGRACFVGESAHVLPAVASQALNLGLREAHDVASTLARVLGQHGAPGLIDEQVTACLSDAIGAARVADAYYPDVEVDPFVAASYRRILPLIPASGPDLDDAARQLGLS